MLEEKNADSWAPPQTLVWDLPSHNLESASHLAPPHPALGLPVLDPVSGL